MEEEVERQRPKVEECCQEPPVLRFTMVSAAGLPDDAVAWPWWVSYLSVDEYRAVAVEELEGVDDLALHQCTGDDGCGGPPPGANGHLPEPLLQREAVAFSHHSVHDVRLVSFLRKC